MRRELGASTGFTKVFRAVLYGSLRCHAVASGLEKAARLSLKALGVRIRGDPWAYRLSQGAPV